MDMVYISRFFTKFTSFTLEYFVPYTTKGYNKGIFAILVLYFCDAGIKGTLVLI